MFGLPSTKQPPVRTVEDLVRDSESAFAGLTRMVDKVDKINEEITAKVSQLEEEANAINRAKNRAVDTLNKNKNFAKNVRSLYENPKT